MKVFIKLTDTLTLENEEQDFEMDSFDKEGMTKLANDPEFWGLSDVPEQIVDAFVVQRNGETAAFIVRCTAQGAYGGHLVVGVVQKY